MFEHATLYLAREALNPKFLQAAWPATTPPPPQAIRKWFSCYIYARANPSGGSAQVMRASIASITY